MPKKSAPAYSPHPPNIARARKPARAASRVITASRNALGLAIRCAPLPRRARVTLSPHHSPRSSDHAVLRSRLVRGRADARIGRRGPGADGLQPLPVAVAVLFAQLPVVRA